MFIKTIQVFSLMKSSENDRNPPKSPQKSLVKSHKILKNTEKSFEILRNPP